MQRVSISWINQSPLPVLPASPLLVLTRQPRGFFVHFLFFFVAKSVCSGQSWGFCFFSCFENILGLPDARYFCHGARRRTTAPPRGFAADTMTTFTRVRCPALLLPRRTSDPTRGRGTRHEGLSVFDFLSSTQLSRLLRWLEYP